ncbi:VIT1/CCC1 transporter family protein [Candidatus Pacearchaeota archaeon]|nr:VIT1/CCC1 transporter family protein [Candidatus Pacearchaeota archaeon]
MVRIGHGAKHFSTEGKYLKSWVYGGLDGIVTTFAVVAGVVGANLSSVIILVLGFANLIGDGISMAVGDYLSTKSEGEYYQSEENIEEKEASKNPGHEEKIMRDVLEKKGFNKSDARQISFLISKNRKYQVETMLHDELGIIYENVSPVKNAVVTFTSFFIFGIIPLFLFAIGTILNLKIPNSFLWASVLSGISIFALGSAKSKVTNKNWFKSGSEMLLVGSAAAIAAYFVGGLLSKII